MDQATIETRLNRIEAELGVAPDAEAERIKRDRERAAAELATERTRLRAEVLTLEDKRLEAIAGAEKAARDLAAAIGKVIEVSMSEASALHKATGVVPMTLHRPDVENRLSGRLAAVMQTVKGNRYRVGHIDWIAGHYKPETNWRDDEAAMLSRHLEQIKGH